MSSYIQEDEDKNSKVVVTQEIAEKDDDVEC